MHVLGSLNPSVVYVHVGAVSPFAWSGVRAALRLGLPTVAVVHSLWDPAVGHCYRALDRMDGWRRAGVVLAAVSTTAADRMRRAWPNADVAVVPNGITPAEWRGIPSPRTSDAHVVAIGRLAARKQPMTLLEVLRAAGSRVRMRATIAGDGPQLAAMRKYLHKHDMDWVHLPGRLDRNDVRTLLADADVFVNTTAHEAFGLAALEARVAGVPVVARHGTGVADFVRDGVEGVLCGSAPELAHALVRLVEHDQERTRIARHNRTTDPEHCTWPQVLNALRSCAERCPHQRRTQADIR